MDINMDGSGIFSRDFFSLLFPLLISIYLCIHMYIYNKVAFFLLMQFIITFLWSSFSIFYIENGNYISEQDIWGENIGSLFRYVCYYSVFIFSSYASIIFFTKNKNINNNSAVYIINNSITIKGGGINCFGREKNIKLIILFVKILFSTLLISSIFLGVKYGFPLLSGMSRFEFYNKISSFKKIIFLMPILSFFIGIAFSITKKKYLLLCLSIIVALLILFSDKFSGIFSVIVYYVIGYYLACNILNQTNQIGFSRKVLIYYLPMVFLFLLCLVVGGYYILHGVENLDLVSKVLLSRTLALQAHVWYGVDFRLYMDLIQYDPYIFFLENNEPSQPAGLIYLMYQVADFNFVQLFREAGIRFTNGYPAIVMVSFGYFYSLFILLFLGTVLGMFLSYLYIKIFKFQPIRLLVALIFYNNIISNIFIMGEMYYMYKILTIVCLLIFGFDIFLLKHKDIKL